MTCAELAALPPRELEAAALGRTWPMLSVKQALAALPLESALAEFAKVIGRPGLTVAERPVLGMHAVARTDAVAFHLIDAGGEPFENRPPVVVGAGDQRTLHGVLRPQWVAAFADVRIRGRSQLVERDGDVLLDVEPHERAAVVDELALDGAVFRHGDGSARVLADPAAEELRVDEAFSLTGPNTYAFGHWLVEYLPRLWLALSHGLLPSGTTILIDRGMAPQHRQALEALAPGHPIIEVAPLQPVRVRRLWQAPAHYYAAIYPAFTGGFRYDSVIAPPALFARLFDGMRTRMRSSFALTGAASPGDRLYLARRPGSHRKLVNHLEVEAIAVRHGFRPVYLERYSFPEQLQLVGDASLLLGPEGSAFFLGYLGRAGTRACVLNHPHTEFLTSVTALLDAVGVATTVFTGPYERVPDDGYLHFADYRIDPDALDRFLVDWTAPQASSDAR